MLLKIIDKPSSDGRNHSIEIVFTTSEGSKSFVSEYFPTSFPESLKKDLAWYFKEYLNGSPTASDRSVIDRLISHGKYMGERLVGDDLQLMCYREWIEESGYSNLTVSVESARIGFFEEPWEALVLPDSKYILSSVAKSFTRRFNNVSSVEEGGRWDAMLEYGLTGESPLKVLHAVVPAIGECNPASNAYTRANELLQYDGAIEYVLWSLGDWPSLREWLLNAPPVHIFQYSGPLVYSESMFFLPENAHSANKSYPVASLHELVRCLQSVKCGLFILNVTEWLCESAPPLAADTGLTLAAQIALTAGMPNVLGLGNLSDPWTADNCLSLVYKNILKGLSLAQSVVEARKALQTQTESDHLNLSPFSFHSWPLLILYELQPVIFCASDQPVAQDILHTRAYAGIRRKMHGFLSEFLPPYSHVTGDSVLLECLGAFRPGSGAVIRIHGSPGSGKTQLLHMLAFYLMRGNWGQAFYFDYAEYFYTAADIREMTAPILIGQNGGQGRCIFMLDNFGPQGEGDGATGYIALSRYLLELSAAQHVIVIAGPVSLAPIAGEVQLTLRPLNPAEQRSMASRLLREHRIDVREYGSEANTLLERCRGNPFLIGNIMPKFSSPLSDELIDRVESLSRGASPDCVDAYYSWQWLELPLPWRRWLGLLVDLQGVILEMLAVVFDSKTPFDPVLELYETIGKPNIPFSEGIALLGKAGFTVKHPLGRVVNPRCISFILRQTAAPESGISRDGKTVQTLLSRIVCRSLVIVIPEVIKKSDHLIIQNLVVNRRQWAKHLENIWKAGEYGEFTSTLSSLTELLKQAGLLEELAQWALRQVSENNEADLNKYLEMPEFLRGWIKLVSLTNRNGQAAQNPVIKQTAEFCDQWIKAITSDQASRQASLFTHIVQFLQTYYRQIHEWTALQTVCEMALREYRRHEVWPLAVAALTSLIECCSEKSNMDQARKFERELLEEVPLDGFHAGFKWQLQAKVVATRLSRAEFDSAQELLDQIYALADNDYQRRLADTLQADIYYRQERLEDAALIYHSLIESAAALDAMNSEDREFFRQRYAEIQSRLKPAKLAAITQPTGT